MRYIFSGSDGTDHEKTGLDFIKELLDYPPAYWQEGSGDCAVSVNSVDRLIFLKLPEGFFIMQHPDYRAPLIINDKIPAVLTHYVGGEPFEMPDVCLCDTATALKIISHYINTNGELYPGYYWSYISDLIEGED